MKRIIITLGFILLVLPIQARADSTSTAFDYTGVTANYSGEGSTGAFGFSGIWLPGSGGTGTQIWPTSAAGEFGIAQQFSITTPTDITALLTNVSVNTSNLSAGQTASTTLTWDLYSGSNYVILGKVGTNPVPLPSSLVVQSTPVVINANGSVPSGVVTEQLAFNANLQPGNYWIAEQANDYGNAIVTPSQTYIDPGQNGNTAQTPEPAVWVAMGLCALFILWKGGRYVGGVV